MMGSRGQGFLVLVSWVIGERNPCPYEFVSFPEIPTHEGVSRVPTAAAFLLVWGVIGERNPCPYEFVSFPEIPTHEGVSRVPTAAAFLRLLFQDMY
jgi:hypothetical protein